MKAAVRLTARRMRKIYPNVSARPVTFKTGLVQSRLHLEYTRRGGLADWVFCALSNFGQAARIRENDMQEAWNKTIIIIRTAISGALYGFFAVVLLLKGC